jgi:CheY-like chemotaxis protein
MADFKSALVVDDDADIRESLRDLLELAGYRVYEAEDGLQALQVLEAGVVHPCVVVLDVMMPNMDGHGFLAALSRRPELSRRLGVVVWTAGSDKAFGPPVPFAVLRKPAHITQLLDTIAAACAQVEWAEGAAEGQVAGR